MAGWNDGGRENPENLVITTPQERHPESTVKIIRPVRAAAELVRESVPQKRHGRLHGRRWPRPSQWPSNPAHRARKYLSV